MPSTIFQRTDTRFIAAALADNTTHSGISTFELSLDHFRSNSGANKGERANQVVTEIFRRSDTDALVLSLLNYLFVENPYALTSDSNTSYKLLRTRVLDPRGVTLTDNGYTLSDGRDVDSFSNQPAAQAPVPTTHPAEPRLSTSPPQWSPLLPQPTRDAKKVFVVHGRDMRPVGVVARYLQFLHLELMPWSAAVALANGSQPHTYDIVKAGIENAAAVIVIFSPDDLAHIKDEFSQPGDPDRVPTGQARPNVLLEAGMAFALARERTIFVQSAPTREISDIAGFNWIKLNGAFDSRLDLWNRLDKAGADVRKGTFDLMDNSLAGPFVVT